MNAGFYLLISILPDYISQRSAQALPVVIQAAFQDTFACYVIRTQSEAVRRVWPYGMAHGRPHPLKSHPRSAQAGVICLAAH